MQATMALALAQGAASLATGVSGFQRGNAEAEAMERNARIHETRAVQRDAHSRDELNRTIAGINAARGANGLTGTSPTALALLEDANHVLSRQRQVAVGNERGEARSLRAAAAGRRRTARFSLVSGVLKSGVSIGQGFA